MCLSLLLSMRSQVNYRSGDRARALLGEATSCHLLGQAGRFRSRAHTRIGGCDERSFDLEFGTDLILPPDSQPSFLIDIPRMLRVTERMQRWGEKLRELDIAEHDLLADGYTIQVEAWLDNEARAMTFVLRREEE